MITKSLWCFPSRLTEQALAIEVFDIVVFVVGVALVLTGALYYGINCHYPS